MKKEVILVTGGAGFIGSHVADELLSIGKSVVVLDDLSGGFRGNVPSKADFVQGSVLDLEVVKEIFVRYKVTHIYHLAAYAAEGLSHFIRRFNYENNLVGSINLINLAILHKVQCFVFTSSIAVYGKNQLPFTEATQPVPEDPYGVSKLAVELDLHCAHDMFGLNYVIFRPHNVYGERQNIGDKYRNVIGIFMNRILQGGDMPIFGDGNQTRAFSYITDVSAPIAHAGFMQDAYNKTFNIGADTSYTINVLATEVARALGVEKRVQYLAARNEVDHAYSAHVLARSVFGKLIQDVSLEQGIGKMAAWAQKHGPQPTSKFGAIEIEENLPPSWRA